MPASDELARWDVVRVPFPYTARPIQQFRPALVLSNGLPEDAPCVIWVLMITSAANRFWAGDVPVSDLKTAGLPAPSVVRTAKIATIEIADADRVGRLSPRDIAGVLQQLVAILPTHLLR